MGWMQIDTLNNNSKVCTEIEKIQMVQIIQYNVTSINQVIKLFCTFIYI